VSLNGFDPFGRVEKMLTGRDQTLDRRPDDRQRLVRLVLRKELHPGMVNSAFRLTRSAPICGLLALALLSAGCGERSEPVGELPQPYPVRVQGAGDRTTVLEARPERIVALDPGPSEILIAIEAGDRLVGVPAGLVRGSAADAEVVVRKTGQVDVGVVVDLEPDLIVATPSVDQLDLARARRESNAAVYVQPEASIQSIQQGIIDLGFLVGQAPAARQLVARIQRDVAAVEEQLSGQPPVSVFVDTGFFITVPDRSLLGDLVRKARGQNIAGEAPGVGPFPLADLAAANPRVYLATSDSGVRLADLRGNPALRDVKAVRSGALRVVPVKLVTRPGPRIAAALERIAEALHPDAFR
jgi:iron complex transport system substrate-binding protein